MKKDIKQKLKEEMEKRGIRTTQLAMQTGIPKDRIYAWYRDNSTPKAEDQALLENWLSGGENSNFNYLQNRFSKKLNENKGGDIPVYIGNTRAGTIEVYSDDPDMQTPIGHLPSNIFPGCNHAEKVTGDSMYPQIVNQAYVIGKIIDKRGFLFGEKYVIHTKYGQSMVKYVHSSEQAGHIKIVSFNKSVPPQDIPMDDITFTCRVFYIVNPS